jgi:hypothetical protein
MAGTFTIKALADGTLPLVKTTLYTVPVSTRTIIKTITYVNTDTSTVNVNLYINSSGTSRRIIPKDLALGKGSLMETDEEYTLEAGDLIEGDSSVAAVVDYTINGVEET